MKEIQLVPRDTAFQVPHIQMLGLHYSEANFVTKRKQLDYVTLFAPMILDSLQLVTNIDDFQQADHNRITAYVLGNTK